MTLTPTPVFPLLVLLLTLGPPNDSPCVGAGIRHVDREGRLQSYGWRRLNSRKARLSDRTYCGYPLGAGGLTNGAFDTNLDGWVVEESGGSVTPGTVTWEAGEAVVREGDSFLTTLRQTFVVPQQPLALEFDLLFDRPGFDLGDAFIPDAFEASLLDATLHSVVPTWMPGAGSFFNLQEDLALNLGPTTSFDGLTVTVDLTGVPAGTIVTLFFDQIGADFDSASGVRLDNVSLLTAAEPPECPPTVSLELWPPNHQYVPIDIAAVTGVTDPHGLPLTVVVTSITQDELVNEKGSGQTSCDGRGVGTALAELRAERSGLGDGRVDHVHYVATNTAGLNCTGMLLVTVPHSQDGTPAVDAGELFDSTSGCL